MTPSDLVTERLETLLLARLSTLKEPKTKPTKTKPTKTKPTKTKPLTTAAVLASDAHRFAPATVDATQWRDRVEACLQGLQDRGVVDAELRVRRADELKQRTGAHAVQRWQQWPDRILPALALGVRADDAKAHQRLSDRDAWAAAIVARAQGLWTKGPPPTLPGVCDALAWRSLGLTSTPRTCPAEVRAYFLRSYIEIDAGPPERMLRQLAAKLVGAPRADLKALYLALIRAWLTGHEPGAQPAAEPPPSDARRVPGFPVVAHEPSLIDAVRSAARAARDGVFGDRKVFISSVWHALRATPPWSQLDLDEFKARLVSAHRQRELELARADLVAAMDPTLVAASETRTDGATFHFIVREPVQ
jgi:hypothetical protein